MITECNIPNDINSSPVKIFDFLILLSSFIVHITLCAYLLYSKKIMDKLLPYVISLILIICAIHYAQQMLNIFFDDAFNRTECKIIACIVSALWLKIMYFLMPRIKLDLNIPYYQKFINDIINSIPNAILIVNRYHQIIYANNKANGLFGTISRDSKPDFKKFFNAPDQNLLKEELSKSMSDPTYQSDLVFEIQHSNGQNACNIFRVTIVTCIKEPLHVYLITMTNVTQFRRFERFLESKSNALQHTSIHLNKILNTMVDAVVTVNNLGIINGTNSAFVSLFGYTKFEFNETHISKFILGDNRFVKNASHTWQQDLLSDLDDQDHNVKVLRGRRVNGSMFNINASISSLIIDDQKHYCLILRDLTAQNNADRRLMKAHRRLAKKHLALEQSKQDLELFNYVASHDLKEPLRGIQGYCKLLEGRYGGDIPPKDRHYFDSIFYSIKNMRDLITGIRDFSKLKDVPRSTAPIDLITLINNVMYRVKGIYAHLNIEYDILSCNSIVGYQEFVDLLLTNIIINAVKYNRQSSIKIIFNQVQNNHSVTFSVADNGFGLNKCDHIKIFDLFTRLHSKHEIPGSGIGLSICKRIMDIHKGKIWVSSTINLGSTFYMSFPLKNRKSEKIAA